MKQALRTIKPFRDTEQSDTLTADSFELLYRQYAGKVYQKCLSMTKDSDTAQDFTHDIFMKVFAKLSSFQNRSAFSTWLYSVSHNYCLDQLRIGKRFSTESFSEGTTSAVAEQDPSSGVECRLQALEEVMKRLPAPEVDLLRLKYEQGLSITEIAQHYGLNESAVKMRLKRTRDKLRTLYVSQEAD